LGRVEEGRGIWLFGFVTQLVDVGTVSGVVWSILAEAIDSDDTEFTTRQIRLGAINAEGTPPREDAGSITTAWVSTRDRDGSNGPVIRSRININASTTVVDVRDICCCELVDIESIDGCGEREDGLGLNTLVASIISRTVVSD
jgi:hypothetical protein